jgi:hypothetical protein
MIRKITVLIAGILVLGVLTAGVALAEANGPITNAANRLHLGGPYHGADNSVSDCGSLSWRDVGTNGKDSPIDTNDEALVANICPGDFAEAYTNRSLRIDTPLADVQNISFDYRTATITGPGQVYIGIVLKDGTILYADPYYCNHPISGSSTWSRADFTGTTAAGACTIYDSNSVAWTSDGAQSALDVYATAHPDAVVSYTFMGFFNTTGSTVTYVVDRIALGTNRLYNYNNRHAVYCGNSEAKC